MYSEIEELRRMIYERGEQTEKALVEYQGAVELQKIVIGKRDEEISRLQDALHAAECDVERIKNARESISVALKERDAEIASLKDELARMAANDLVRLGQLNTRNSELREALRSMIEASDHFWKVFPKDWDESDLCFKADKARELLEKLHESGG